MKYPCIPIWMKERAKDPFDYPLRSKKEIAFEQYMHPPLFHATIFKNEFTALTDLSTMSVNKVDNRNNEVKIELNIQEMQLSPLQKKRLIFLLGQRYKNDNKVKIVCRQYTSYEHNLTKAVDIFRQLYWEAKRAPLYHWPMTKNIERRRAARKLFGKLPPEEMKKRKTLAEEEVNKQKEIFDQVYNSGNYNLEFVKNNIQRHLDMQAKKKVVSEEEEKIKIQEAEKKIEEILTKGSKEKELVRKNILSRKAYDTFYNNQLEVNKSE